MTRRRETKVMNPAELTQAARKSVTEYLMAHPILGLANKVGVDVDETNGLVFDKAMDSYVAMGMVVYIEGYARGLKDAA
jgi:hypothetical protein